MEKRIRVLSNMGGGVTRKLSADVRAKNAAYAGG
jgi:hypothetical protein